MKLISTAFKDGEMIPAKYTADGMDISPPLEISEAPEGVVSFALVMDDPDAPVGTWDHWIIWNISPETRKIEEDAAPKGVKGKNSWGTLNYGGPAPPSGTHRYIFKIYALDKKLDLKEGADKSKLERAMKEHVLDHAFLMGKYSR